MRIIELELHNENFHCVSYCVKNINYVKCNNNRTYRYIIG